MDEKQKDLLRDGALFIASTVEESGKFDELAMLLQDRKLLSEGKVKEIKVSFVFIMRLFATTSVEDLICLD